MIKFKKKTASNSKYYENYTLQFITKFTVSNSNQFAINHT